MRATISSTIIIVMSCLLGTALAQTARNFQAKVKIQDFAPDGQSAPVYEGVLHYRWDTKHMKIVYSGGANNPALEGFTEVFDYDAKVLYKLPCSTCEAFKTGLFMPEFFRRDPQDTPGGEAIRVDGRDCQAFRKTSPTAGGVETVWTHVPDPMKPTEAQLCQVQYTAASGGRKIIFDKPTGTAGSFSHPSCTPKCGAPLDLTFVIDESGSINAEEWTAMNNFVKRLIDQFELGPDQTHVGIAYFAGVTFSNSQDPSNCCGFSDSALALEPNKVNVETVLDNHKKRGGHTCINCGIRAAQRYYPNPRRTTNHKQVMIVITDGYNNRETNYFEQDVEAARAHAGGIEMFAVGVANSDANQLATIANGNVNRVYRDRDYAALLARVKDIADQVCAELQSASPCGPSCKGPCLCKRTCACPTSCTDRSVCEKGVCPNPETGCVFKTNNCATDNTVCPVIDKCKAPVCVGVDTVIEGKLIKAGECGELDINCDDNDPCTVDSCAGGFCLNAPQPCPSNECSKSRCINGQCVVDPASVVACPAPNPCEEGVCTGPHGTCATRKKICDTGNPCMVSECGADGNCSPPVAVPGCAACVTTDPCRPMVWQNGACVQAPAVTDAGQLCDDRDPCTVDTCVADPMNPLVPQCVHTPVECPHTEPRCKKNVCSADATDPRGYTCGGDLPNLNCDDGNACTLDTCTEAEGCVHTSTCPQSVDACACPVCDPQRGCTLVPKVCDDNNRCTTDTCVAGKCTYTPAAPCPEPEDKCKVVTCDPVKQCVVSEYDCSKIVPASPCHIIKCAVVNGAPKCVERPLAGLVDQCGRCKAANVPCFPGGSSGGAAAGVVTGIVIASALLGGALAIALGACLATKAATGGAAVSAAPAAAASVNPLYESDNLSFDNPLASGSVL